MNKNSYEFYFFYFLNLIDVPFVNVAKEDFTAGNKSDLICEVLPPLLVIGTISFFLFFKFLLTN